MISDELKKNYEDAAKLFNNYKPKFRDELLTKKDIEKYMRDNGVEPNIMFLPSDLCYNHTTRDLLKVYDGFEEGVHLFEYLGRNKYKILGEKYPYTGKIIRKRKADKKEVVVGEWLDGKLVKWDPSQLLDD